MNVLGTLNLLRGIQSSSAARVIYTSSSEVYGNGKSPFREDQIPCPHLHIR